MKEDKISLWLGVVVTILVAGLFFAYFRSIKLNNGKITTTASQTESKSVEYEIKKGDTLWKIAQENYGDGYAWTNIYENNKTIISNPNIIETGTKIVIPKLESQKELKSYTVQKGDNLWKIADVQCGSGYMWTDIAIQNNLQNPRVIHAGNVLKIRCEVR